MASQHIYPTTSTRLAGELTGIIRQMRAIDSDLPQLKAIMDQIASGGDFTSLATELGFATAADAETAYNLIGSLVVELQAVNSPFWAQVISRMG